MAARRAQQAKQSLASNSNLSTLASNQANNNTRARLKSTSMTNLVASSSSTSNTNLNQGATRIQRPASRNALDNIHKGMNAKFTHVQSKVLLQNIRPQQQQQQQQQQVSKIPAKADRLTPTTPSSTLRRSTPQPTASNASGPKIQLSDRSQLINKIKALQEELERHERQRDELKHELDRERADKAEQVQQIKFELQERVAESERQNEEYHQKLLEAYELADQNRRAADTVLSESRQREDELRKKIDDLEQQLGELKEFVAMKEEMMGKMSEMREQIRIERERYEEKTRSLHQMFENEKISSSHMRVDQNSNYFGRAKPSLQSVESINRLDDGGHHQSNGHHHRSEQDMYGSKLSTRMQDGAKLAWKKSRKFASSVITGSLGGLSACRRHNNNNDNNQAATSGLASRRPMADCQPQPSQAMMHSSGVELSGTDAGQHQHQHTSVVEVGSTVGEFMAHQQPVGNNSSNEQLAAASSEPYNSNTTQDQDGRGLIRVDENNKLTIVTKFSSNNQQTSANQDQLETGPPKSSPFSSSSPSSERSRCESSSSGRGTASDSGGSGPGSQNGDHPDQPLDMQQQRAGVIKTAMGEQEAPQRKPEPHQRHKRKSSLFKASAFSGSQASLNKTFKSFFALASSKATSSAARHSHSFDSTTQPTQFTNNRIYSEVFVEAAGRHLGASTVGASTPTSSLKSSSLTDSDRTITGGGGGELSSNAAYESNERTATTTKILNEFVRYEERTPDKDEIKEANNNEPQSINDDKVDVDEIGKKAGQGDREHADEGHQTSATRFEQQHRQAVAVEH